MTMIIAHRPNGLYIEFPNGNSISTIWGSGSYTEAGDIVKDNTEPIILGSKDVEILIGTNDDKLAKRIYRKLAPDSSEAVIGRVSILDWLWVLNQLAKTNPLKE